MIYRKRRIQLLSIDYSTCAVFVVCACDKTVHEIQNHNIIHSSIKWNQTLVSIMMTSSNGNILPRYWSFVRGPVNSPRKGQWRRTLMFSVIDAQINGWVNTGEADDLRNHHTHYDVIVVYTCNTLLNSFRPCDACIGRWKWSSSFPILVLRLLGQDQCWSNASWIIKTNFSKIESNHKI